MEGMMKGLFGGDNDNDSARVERARDFARRYTEGDPSSGYDEDEALEQFNAVIGNASAEEVERATRATLQNLPASDRAQFGDFVGQLRQRDPRNSGGGMAGGGGSFDIDDISRMFGQAGGQSRSANDMFGGLLGGGGGGGMGGGLLGGLLGGGGGGLGGLLGGGGSGGSGGLGGLLGGGGGQGSAGGGLGGMLGGPMGKMILGGIAAYLIQDKLK